jgi:hypothetical protein
MPIVGRTFVIRKRVAGTEARRVLAVSRKSLHVSIEKLLVVADAPQIVATVRRSPLSESLVRLVEGRCLSHVRPWRLL